MTPADSSALEPPEPRERGLGKGDLGPRGHVLALALLAVPLLMLAARGLATPGVRGAWPGGPVLAELGDWLNAVVTLAWVPAQHEHSVTYLLLLPIAATLIVLARLTFGLRVLGYRSILIAVGFTEVGILPSFLVMLLVFGIIAVLRPSMRRARMSMYARVSLILAVTACLQVSFLLVGTWLRSDLTFSLAFFPVIILAMMAESIAGTMDTHNIETAAWRFVWTLVVAFIIYALLNSRAVTTLLERAPEILLLHLGLILLISEYVDLRLLQDWRTQVAGLGERWPWLAEGVEQARRRRVAVVRNRSLHGTIGHPRHGAATQLHAESIQHIVDALRDRGYQVKVFEGDMTLLRELAKFLPPNPRTGSPGGVVLNLGGGIHGEGRLAHVPAMLEMAGIAYTGAGPTASALMSDRARVREALQGAGLPVLAAGGEVDLQGGFRPASFPVVLVPREPSSDPLVVSTPEELRRALKRLAGAGVRHLLGECVPSGRLLRVGVAGDRRLHSLPPVQLSARETRHSPATLDAETARKVQAAACDAFRALGCRGYACVDLWLPDEGEPQVCGVTPQFIFGRRSPTASALQAAGAGWGDLAAIMVETAALHWGVEWVLRAEVPPPSRPAAALTGSAS